ncbi:MAG: hypothetical protein R3A51_18825 [Nannocystaceae bacterium]
MSTVLSRSIWTREGRARTTLAIAAAALLGCQPDDPAASPRATLRAAPPAPTESAAPAQADEPVDLAARLAEFVPAELTADIADLPPSERAALDELIAAAKLLDPVFDRQAYAGNPALAQRLAADKSPEGRTKRAYFEIMRGPWDRQRHFEPFAIDAPHPKGAGFYPEDLTAEVFEAEVAGHPEDAAALRSLFTVVERDPKDRARLIARPYSDVYGEWLEPAAARLEAAAALTKSASLRKFLKARAAAFRSDDYYASDKAWMDLDSRVEITIGPYETYEDELLGLKASFEAFVTVSDPEASRALSRFKALLPDMERHLPIPDAIKTVRGAESPIRVVDLVYTSGDARKSVQTIAFNLPNDERVRKEKGAKKVLLRNLIETKFEKIMRPIAAQILSEEQLPLLSAEAFFDEVLFHELSHSLGPAFTTRDGEQVEVRVALGASYSPVEEAKADVMGAYNILYMIDRGELPEELREPLLVSYFAGLFRSVRFGVAEAHGKGAALQINFFLEYGAAGLDEVGKLRVSPLVLQRTLGVLVRELCVLQASGDKAAVDRFLERYGVMTPPIEDALAKLDGIPVDIRPIYPLAGEAGGR